MSHMKSKHLRTAIRILLFAIFAGLFVWFFLTHKSDFSILTRISPYLLVLIALGQLGVIVTNVVFQISLLRIYGVNMPWWESFVVIVKSSVINFFGFFQGGAGYRAYYLKKNYGVNYSRFALLFTANYLVVFFISALFGFIGSLLQLRSGSNGASYPVVIFFALAALGLLTLMFVSPSKIPGKSKLLVRIRDVLGEWDHIVSSKRRLLALFVIGVIQFWFLAGSFYFELKAIHASTTVAGLMVYSAIAGFSILVALTPAAIGFRETLLIFARQSLGVSISTIILSATVDRFVYFFLLLGLSIVTQNYVVNFVSKQFSKEVSRGNNAN